MTAVISFIFEIKISQKYNIKRIDIFCQATLLQFTVTVGCQLRLGTSLACIAVVNKLIRKPVSKFENRFPVKKPVSGLPVPVSQPYH